MPRNVIVAQSGGPSPVINNSLRGVIDTCSAYPSEFGKVYGGWHGIEGVLKEELLDISAQDPAEIALLATTPAAGDIEQVVAYAVSKRCTSAALIYPVRLEKPISTCLGDHVNVRSLTFALDGNLDSAGAILLDGLLGAGSGL